jgi:hypothetical protein
MAAGHNDAEIWERLLTRIAPKLIPTKKYCAVRSIQGSRYVTGKGLAVIGRAPNGWPIEFCKQEADDPDQRVNLVRRILAVHVCTADAQMIDGQPDCGPMHWVRHRRCSSLGVTDNSKIGRFWSTVAGFAMDLAGPDLSANWEETIAWTNLYPVSHESGNPGEILSRAQLAESANLLASTLEAWRPRVAVFITEVNSLTKRSLEWSAPFHEPLHIRDIQYKDEGPIVATARLGQNTQAVFLVRPDARRGKSYDFRGELTRKLNECGVGGPETTD